MATKIQKLYAVICSDCRSIVGDQWGTPPRDFTSCPKCGLEFEDGPLSASNTTANLPQTNVKYYG